MCVAIPLGRRPDGPQGTRLGRYLRARPWRFTAAVPLVLAPLLGALWALGELDPGAPLVRILLAQGLAAAPLFGLLMTGLSALTRTSPPGHLALAALAALFLLAASTTALGLFLGPAWTATGLSAMAWAWWLGAGRLRRDLVWARVRLPRPMALLPFAAYGGAVGLGVCALVVTLGPRDALPALAIGGACLTLLIALLGTFALRTGQRASARA
jgi:hypothetical protein